MTPNLLRANCPWTICRKNEKPSRNDVFGSFSLWGVCHYLFNVLWCGVWYEANNNYSTKSRPLTPRANSTEQPPTRALTPSGTSNVTTVYCTPNISHFASAFTNCIISWPLDYVHHLEGEHVWRLLCSTICSDEWLGTNSHLAVSIVWYKLSRAIESQMVVSTHRLTSFFYYY